MQEPLPGEQAPVTVHADRWRAGLPPNAWPDDFPTDGTVWRRDVFAVADAYRAGSASPRHLLTAVLVWGYGPIGYGPWRAARSLGADPDGRRLAYALREPAFDEDALRTAYRRFRDPDHARLPWLGPGLFTKVLYFAGYRRGGWCAAADPRPGGRPPPPRRSRRPPPRRLVGRGVAGVSALGLGAGPGRGCRTGRGGDGATTRPGGGRRARRGRGRTRCAHPGSTRTPGRAARNSPRAAPRCHRRRPAVADS